MIGTQGHRGEKEISDYSIEGWNLHLDPEFINTKIITISTIIVGAVADDEKSEIVYC